MKYIVIGIIPVLIWLISLKLQTKDIDHVLALKSARVTKVIDGDTINVTLLLPEKGEIKVRLLGIDTPEIKSGTKMDKDILDYGISKENMIAAGMKAKEFLSSKLTPNKLVYLESDPNGQDKYGREPLYVWIIEKNVAIMINELLLEKDYAKPRYLDNYFTKEPLKYKSRLLSAYKNRL